MPNPTPHFWKRCEVSEPLAEALANVQVEALSLTSDVDASLDSVDLDTASSALDTVNDQISELYSRSGRRCDILCEYDLPSTADSKEQRAKDKHNVIVVGGKVLLSGGTSLQGPSAFYEVVEAELPDINRDPLDILRDMLKMQAGSFAVIFSTESLTAEPSVATSITQCGVVSSWQSLHIAVWDKARPTLRKYQPGNNQASFQTLQQVAATNNLDPAEIDIRLFWIDDRDATGGAFSQLEKLGLTVDQLVVCLLGNDEASGQFDAGNLTVYTLQSGAIDSLINYGLNESKIRTLLKRKVDGVDTTATRSDLAIALSKLVDSEQQIGNCGINMESVAASLLNTVNLNDTFNLDTAGEDCYSEQVGGEVKEFLQAVVAAVNGAIQTALTPFQKAQSMLSGFISKVEGIENALWSLVDPEAQFGSSILKCLFGGSINIPGSPAIGDVVDALIAGIPGSGIPIEAALAVIDTILDQLAQPVCFSGFLIDQVLSMFGVDATAVPIVGCFFEVYSQVNLKDLLGEDLQCMLDYLSEMRNVIRFALQLLLTIKFKLNEILGVIKALAGGVEVRFESSRVCAGSNGETFAFAKALVGLFK